MEKGEILDQIGDIYDEHCKGCEKWRVAAPYKHSSKADDFCNNKCNIGKRMQKLGDYLTYGRPTKVGRSLTKDVYLQETKNGLTDEQIAEKHGMTVHPLVFRKRYWKLSKGPKRVDLTKESYQEMKSQGLPDSYIAKKVGLHPSKLSERRAGWGISADPKKVNLVERGENGEDINHDSYLSHKAAGLTDHEICELWGLGRVSLQRRKRNWRECGYDVDKYNNNIPKTVRR